MKQYIYQSIKTAIAFCFLFIGNRTQAQEAQVVPDATLRVNSQLAYPKTSLEQVLGGTVAGSNLFHSFEKFNINESNTVEFVSPSSAIANILVRVTGGNRSEIKGTLATSGSSQPNLFLINPNGILFGPKAKLDIKGSFIATTANAIQFGDGATFSASIPNNPELLTVNPSAFLFNQIKSASIINQSTTATTGLKVPNGKSLLLVGGDINLQSGGLNAQGGYIELGGLTGSGSIGLNADTNLLKLNFPDNAQLANVLLTDSAKINALGQDGKIVINSQDLRLDNSSLSIGSSSRNTQEANLIINARGNINVIQSRILSNGSNINISAKDIVFSNNTRLSSPAQSRNAGNVNINARNSFNLVASEIASDSNGVGNGGTIDINAKSLFLTDGGVIYTRARNQGNAGNIKVNADDINIDGVNTNQGFSSGLLTASEEEDSGRAGNIDITTQNLRISDGGVLSARTLSPSPGGNISVNANKIELFDGGQIVTSTFNSGNAGNIDINANSVQIYGIDPTYFERIDKLSNSGVKPIQIIDNDSAASGLFARASGDAAGSGGNIQVTANSINLDKQGAISSGTTSGNGGNIQIQNFQLLELRNKSQISTTAGTENSPGNGGNITIQSPNGFIVAVPEENSDITANAYNGQGGFIKIDVQGIYGFQVNQQLTSASDITAFSQLNPQLNGVVEIDRSTVEPSQGLVELPSVPIDIRLAQTCQSTIATNQSSFSIIGRGGLPPNPKEALSGDAVQVGWLLPRASSQNNKIASVPKISIPEKPVEIVEANTWVRNSKGEILLSVNQPAPRQSDNLLSQAQCQPK